MIWDISVGLIIFIVLSIVIGLAVIRRLYFNGNGPRRRMPNWLIICVIISFLILPKLDLAYMASREKHGEVQVA